MRFDGKIAVVTGAGSGFGEAIATRFAREGARVVVADVNEENGRRVVSAIAREGGAARFFRADVSRSADVKAMVDDAVAGFGGLAVEVAPFHIRVNAVNPVAAETGFMKTATGLDKLPEELRKQLVTTIPLGRLTEPRDVAAAVLFLASDEAEFLTGVCLPVDGGRSI